MGLNNNDENNPFAGENPNDIDFVTKLVFDETKIDPALKVFRLFDKPDLLIFHESVVKAIRKQKLSGFVFVPVSEYTDVIPGDDDIKVKEKENEKSKVVQPETPAPSVKKEEPTQPKTKKFNFFVD
jgi:hypothetical protein